MAARLNPRRISAFRALWRAVRHGRRPGAPSLGERARALPEMVSGAAAGRYPGLSRSRLAMFVLALAYLVSPVDLVPELFLSLLGLGDDVAVGLWLAGATVHETDRYLDWKRGGAIPDELGHAR